MLPKSQRLNLKTSFKKVASGRHLEVADFKIMYRFEGEEAKVGIALSKANFNRAHLRNRAKRLTSKAMELLYPSLRKGLNLVIIPKASVLDKSPEEILDELKTIKDIH